MNAADVSTTAQLIAAFASGNADPQLRAAEIIDVLAADPTRSTEDIAAIRHAVEKRLATNPGPNGVLLIS
jgi:hypothetical protein